MMNVTLILAADTPASTAAHNIMNCKISRVCDVQTICHVTHLRNKNLYKLLKMWRQILEFLFKKKTLVLKLLIPFKFKLNLS